MGQHRKRNKSLGLLELVAIALGGMVGGGIFTIMGISAKMVGFLTPVAIICGGLIAALAAYSYVKLGVYYKDEGATYAFYKRTYPGSPFAAAAIGWFVVFGYISTLALYAYTFAGYAVSGSGYADNALILRSIAVGIIAVFTVINIWSVNGMGKLEDIMVYTKLVMLCIISFLLIKNGTVTVDEFIGNMSRDVQNSGIMNILIVASITFVAYEGFQLVINAVNEMKSPEKNIPRAIYSAITLAVVIYVVIASGALFAIPVKDLIENKESALASGAGDILGKMGSITVITGALLATSSAISGTVFGSSRQVSAIARDGYLPKFLSVDEGNTPKAATIGMATLAAVLVLAGGLQLILEFGSVTFLLVSLLMAIANYKVRSKTGSSKFITLAAITGLAVGGVLILYYELQNKWQQMIAILGLYIVLATGAWLFSKKANHRQ